jgi:hypothetical protein
MIGKIDGQPGIGIYHFKDERNFSVLQYYRLKIIEKDGHYFYSKVLAVRKDIMPFNIRAALVVGNNGLKFIVNADIKRSPWFELIDLNGRRLKLWQQLLEQGTNIFSINNLHLPNGGYAIRVWDRDGLRQSFLFPVLSSYTP